MALFLEALAPGFIVLGLAWVTLPWLKADDERARAASIVGDQHLGQIAQGRRRSGRRPKGDARAPALEDGVVDQSGVVDRQFTGTGCQHADPSHAPHPLSVVVGGKLKGRNHGSQAGVQTFEAVPVRHIADAALAPFQAALDVLPGQANRAEPGHAGNHHTPHHIIPPFTEITCRVMYPASGENR
jgi:hypothetical protein